MDLVLTPLVFTALGVVAKTVIEETCQDYLKTKLLDRFTWLEQLGQRDIVERSYQDAMEQAYIACLEMLLANIKGFGYSDAELKDYGDSLQKFIKDEQVAAELWAAVQEPNNTDLPSPEVLCDRWRALNGLELPAESLWPMVAAAFRRQAQQHIQLNDQLRELYKAQTLAEMRELIERQGGVKIQVRREKYAQRMRSKYSPVDLANLMPAYADDPGRMVIRDVFVPQTVRENPPPVEIPKDLTARLRKAKAAGAAEDVEAILDAQQLETLRTTYVSQSPQPVLDVIAAPANRWVVLTGEPGSGKSTLMRYLLTGVIEPPKNDQGEPLPWTEPFREAFPLLIELREFYALRQRDECDSFLDYVAYMGKTQQWFLDDHAVQDYLETGPSLVMFDGLDEIFDGGDRDRVMHEIAGFAQRYPKARIVVTSRPVGYREQILRNGGFAHFGIQDLGNTQIKTFIEGWFALTFPQNPPARAQRIDRVLGSVEQSKSIRLLAGNPMLLTIMALLAREEELPRERAKFYEKAVEVLCHHWDVNRNLQLTDGYLNADDKKALLRRVALRMQAGEGGLKGNFITEDDLEQEIQRFLLDEQWQADGAAAKKAARRIIQQLRERNYILCLRGPQLYGFVHRTFLEYLTASAYVVQFEKQRSLTFEQLRDEIFGEHWQDEAWHEVLCLICGAIDEEITSRIIIYLSEKYSGSPQIERFKLAASCLLEVKNRYKIKDADEVLLERFLSMMSEVNDLVENDVTSELCKSIEITWGYTEKIFSWLKTFVQSGEYRKIKFILLRDLGSAWNTHEKFSVWLKNLARNGKNKSIQKAAVLGLTYYGGNKEDWDLFKLLKDLFKKDIEAVSQSALMGIANTWKDLPETESILKGCLSHDDPYIRWPAVEALARDWKNDTDTLPMLKRALLDDSQMVRREALIALANCPDWLQLIDIREACFEIAANDPFSLIIDDKDSHFELSDCPKFIALETMLSHYPEDSRVLEILGDRALNDPDEELRKWAQEQLEKFSSNEIPTGRVGKY